MSKERNLTPWEGFNSLARFDHNVGNLREHFTRNHYQITQNSDLIALAVDHRAANDRTEVDFTYFSSHNSSLYKNKKDHFGKKRSLQRCNQTISPLVDFRQCTT